MMKKAVLVLWSLLSICTMNAQNVFYSQLNLRLIDNSNFTMVVDGMVYNNPSSIYNINIVPGSHLISVLLPVNRLLYQGVIEIPAYTTVYSFIDAFSNYRVISMSSMGSTSSAYPSAFNNTNYMPVAPNAAGVGNGVRPPMGMDPIAFYILKARIYSAGSSLEQFKIARMAIPQNTICSGQLAEVLQLIEFESYRIDLAKFAYPYTTDKENYFLINDSFSFKSSAEEVRRYLESKSN